MRGAIRSTLTGAALCITLVVSACSPSPPPPPRALAAPTPAPTPAPVPQPCPQSTVANVQDEAAHAAAVGTSGAEVVVVAVDEAGRPEIVTTSPEHAPEAASSLDAVPDLDVVVVEPDRTMSATGTVASGGDPQRPQQWALDALAIESVWGISTGVEVDVAVIDTGVLGTHPDLAGKVCSGVAFLGSNGVAQLGQGAKDPHGHGTHVAGTVAAARANGLGIAGVAPSARIIPVRVLDAQGLGSSSDVARGITWAVDHGAEVVNLSLSGAHSGAVEAAVDYAESRGVVVVAAAGNSGPSGAPNHPAALPDTIAVGSHGQNGLVSSFSTWGDYVDLSAPGSGILSTTHDGAWGHMSGTSMATPHVAGVVAALVAAEADLTPAQVRARLRDAAVDAGPVGHDPAYGWGRVNAVGALGG